MLTEVNLTKNTPDIRYLQTMSIKNDVIVFTGPIAGRKEIPPGGFESANRRTIDLLNSRSITVHELPYPKKNNQLEKLLFYPARFFLINVKIISIRLKNLNKKCICHITPLYKNFLYIELITILLCSALKYRIIYDIRAGSLMIYYNSRGKLYKNTLKFILKISDKIFIEGIEYEEFVKNISKKSPYYFPNYVDNITSIESIEARAVTLKNEIRLVYFGRITPEKGIEMCIDIAKELQNRGYNCQFDIIGPISQEYKNDLCRSLPANVIIKEGMKHDSLFKVIKNCHFFVFPTRHRGEGHSNALTEAMAHGCVPICSNNGFNQSVVHECGTVISGQQTSKAYSDAIVDIISVDKWKEYSTKCINRIEKFYLSDTIIPGIINIYNQL